MTASTNKSAKVVQPYLFFEGRCEEALEFYRTAVGAEVEMMMRFKDNPEPDKSGGCQPGDPNKIMHMSFRIGETTVMGSDGRCTGKPNFEGFGLSITVPTPDEADKFFNALAQGGKVEMPLMKTFYSPRFGMVVDKFGVFWMIMAAA